MALGRAVRVARRRAPGVAIASDRSIGRLQFRQLRMWVQPFAAAQLPFRRLDHALRLPGVIPDDTGRVELVRGKLAGLIDLPLEFRLICEALAQIGLPEHESGLQPRVLRPAGQLAGDLRLTRLFQVGENQVETLAAAGRIHRDKLRRIHQHPPSLLSLVNDGPPDISANCCAGERSLAANALTNNLSAAGRRPYSANNSAIPAN